MKGHLRAVGAVNAIAAAPHPECVATITIQITHHRAGAVHTLAQAPLAPLLIVRRHFSVLEDMVIGGQSVLGQPPVNQALVIHTTLRQVDHGRIGNWKAEIDLKNSSKLQGSKVNAR